MTPRSGVPVDLTTVLVAVTLGALCLATATFVATRRGAPDRRTPRSTALAPLVPWLGTFLTLVLLVRGSFPVAIVVAIATLAHAGVTRARRVTTRRR